MELNYIQQNIICATLFASTIMFAGCSVLIPLFGAATDIPSTSLLVMGAFMGAMASANAAALKVLMD